MVATTSKGLRQRWDFIHCHYWLMPILWPFIEVNGLNSLFRLPMATNDINLCPKIIDIEFGGVTNKWIPSGHQELVKGNVNISLRGTKVRVVMSSDFQLCSEHSDEHQHQVTLIQLNSEQFGGISCMDILSVYPSVGVGRWGAWVRVVGHWWSLLSDSRV